MKRYIRSTYVSTTPTTRNEFTRFSKKTNSRKELYDTVHDVMDMLRDAYPFPENANKSDINLDVVARGRKGNRITAFGFDHNFHGYDALDNRWRFDKNEALDVMNTAQNIVDRLGISDRCNISIVDGGLGNKDEYKVTIEIAPDPDIVD